MKSTTYGVVKVTIGLVPPQKLKWPLLAWNEAIRDSAPSTAALRTASLITCAPSALAVWPSRISAA